MITPSHKIRQCPIPRVPGASQLGRLPIEPSTPTRQLTNRGKGWESPSLHLFNNRCSPCPGVASTPNLHPSIPARCHSTPPLRREPREPHACADSLAAPAGCPSNASSRGLPPPPGKLCDP